MRGNVNDGNGDELHALVRDEHIETMLCVTHLPHSGSIIECTIDHHNRIFNKATQER